MEYNVLKDELLPELCVELTRTVDVRLTKAGNLYLNSEKADHKNASVIFLQLFSQDNLKKFLPLVTHAPSSGFFFETVRIALRSFFKKSKNSTYGELGDFEKFNYGEFVPFISVTDRNQISFIHTSTGKLVDLDYHTYKMVTDPEVVIKPIPAVIEFNPYRPEQMYVQPNPHYGQKCTHINTYKKPEWQFARELSDKERKDYCALPDIINDFFCHLFPDTSSREFVYDWLHFALTLRCETYLVLNGAKGIGKNILAETLCKSLIGKDNHKLAQPGALDSQFNSLLAQSRMIVFDEFKIDDEDKINRLKRYINQEQMIERKGIDVGKTQVTYNSFIICSNSKNDIKIAWDDRRFSVADMTQVKLEEVWPKKKIKELIDSITDPESPVIRNFGYWLLYRTPIVARDNFHAFKGEHFYSLCYAGMAEWQKMVIDEVTSCVYSEIDDGELRVLYKERTGNLGRLPQFTKIEDFLKNYKHRGKHYLGELKREGKNWSILVSEEFRPLDNTGHEWDSVLL